MPTYLPKYTRCCHQLFGRTWPWYLCQNNDQSLSLSLLPAPRRASIIHGNTKFRRGLYLHSNLLQLPSSLSLYRLSSYPPLRSLPVASASFPSPAPLQYEVHTHLIDLAICQREREPFGDQTPLQTKYLPTEKQILHSISFPWTGAHYLGMCNASIFQISLRNTYRRIRVIMTADCDWLAAI